MNLVKINFNSEFGMSFDTTNPGIFYKYNGLLFNQNVDYLMNCRIKVMAYL